MCSSDLSNWLSQNFYASCRKNRNRTPIDRPMTTWYNSQWTQIKNYNSSSTSPKSLMNRSFFSTTASIDGGSSGCLFFILKGLSRPQLQPKLYAQIHESIDSTVTISPSLARSHSMEQFHLPETENAQSTDRTEFDTISRSHH